MSNTIYTLEKIKDIVTPIANKYNVQSIYLFGSYARGEATENSDLDFLVFGGDKFNLTNIFALAEDLRMAFQRQVDVFEISEINTDSDFYSTIMNERLNVAWNIPTNSVFKKYAEKLLTHIDQNNISKENLLNDYALQWLVTTPLYNIGEQVYSLSDEYKNGILIYHGLWFQDLGIDWFTIMMEQTGVSSPKSSLRNCQYY